MNEVVATSNADYSSKAKIIEWINDTLKLNITKIETLGTGAIYCQILDYVHPGKVAVSKLNWKAKFEHEIRNNYKILKKAFDNLGINKVIDENKLIKCKYQDNLEFIQWLKKYFDVYSQKREYDAASKRGHVEIDFNFIEKMKGTSGIPKSNDRKKVPNPASKNISSQVSSKNSSFCDISVIEIEDKEIKQEKPNTEVQNEYGQIAQEKEHYYQKLRTIEQILDSYRDTNPVPLIRKIRDIIYYQPDPIKLQFEDLNAVQDNEDLQSYKISEDNESDLEFKSQNSLPQSCKNQFQINLDSTPGSINYQGYTPTSNQFQTPSSIQNNRQFPDSIQIDDINKFDEDLLQ